MNAFSNTLPSSPLTSLAYAVAPTVKHSSLDIPPANLLVSPALYFCRERIWGAAEINARNTLASMGATKEALDSIDQSQDVLTFFRGLRRLINDLRLLVDTSRINHLNARIDQILPQIPTEGLERMYSPSSDSSLAVSPSSTFDLPLDLSTLPLTEIENVDPSGLETHFLL